MPVWWWNMIAFVLGVGGGMMFADLDLGTLMSIDFIW